MKHATFSVRPVLVACTAVALSAQDALYAEDFDTPVSTGWSVRVGAASRFNIKTSVQNIVPATGAGLYDDGFVHPDSSGTASGKTWNWGYNSASQVSGDQIQYHHLEGPSSIQDGSLSKAALGGDIAARYALYEFEIGKRNARVGFEFGYGYSTFSGNINSASSGSATFDTYNYSTGGGTPPQSPYEGNATGPGMVIDLNPTSHTTEVATGNASFQGAVSTDIHDLRLGPTFEFDITKRLSASVGLGYSALHVDSSLNYSESYLYSNPAFPSSSTTASISKESWLPGVYSSMMLDFRITKHLGVFAEGDFRYNQEMDFEDSTHKIKVDFGSTYGAKGGLVFWF
jgi:hypothetical protein